MIVVTGATGQLGQLVIEELLKTVPANKIVAAVRNPEKAASLAALGVVVRYADYSKPESLETAFTGAERVLLISSNEIGQRFGQHKEVINAAKHAGVKLIAYTSLLHADTSALGLATEHKETEELIKASGIPYVLLRNGWYTENYLAGIPPALQYGVFLGSAGEGKISSAARADYAAAAAVVLTTENQAGKVYELAGDEAYTLAELAAVVAKESGKEVVYKNLPQDEYKAALQAAGLPEAIADLLADSDTGASKGGLFDASHQLSRLIGRPSQPLESAVKAAIP